ncbi:MAG: DUF2961 domain-containing protein [Pirellulales bacterium]|nr:DUF2961 domain-containing protein [Pirellulales bacterium]
MIRKACLLLIVAILLPTWAHAAGPITLETLLDEMVDRTAVARFPDPAYTCHQASSYHRESVAPDQPGWFANQDRSNFIRSETNQGRTEWVLMDEKGPGAIVRFWVTAPHYLGTIRIYLDGADEPVLAERVDKLVGGKALVGPPLSAERSRGRNLYLPIPYAKHCKVTFDRANFNKTNDRKDLLYYQINYRTYAPGTEVTSFSRQQLATAKSKVASVQERLLKPHLVNMPPPGGYHADNTETIKPGGRFLFVPSVELDTTPAPAALYHLMIEINAKDRAQALRSTVLAMEFDGQKTVWCPLGDFFGSGVGLNPYRGWYRRIPKKGELWSYWVMPYQKTCRIWLENHGQQPVEGRVAFARGPWKWDDRSMYFHANWRQQRGIPTKTGGKGAIDWNFLKADGQGVFVGDTLALVNRSESWWGEGDEKIYVDGEKFPSHFGTGTEDYYGYAWGNTNFFESPFHAQPRVEGPKNFGNTTDTRVRLLDAIPFRKSLNFDMEVWHWRKTTVDYAATTYWYGRPGATANHRPAPTEAAQPVEYNMKSPVPKKKKNAK